MSPILANILGPDALVVVGVLVLLFGGSQLPKLARSLGSAKTEFEKATREESKPEPAPHAEAKPGTTTTTTVVTEDTTKPE